MNNTFTALRDHKKTYAPSFLTSAALSVAAIPAGPDQDTIANENQVQPKDTVSTMALERKAKSGTEIMTHTHRRTHPRTHP